MLLRDEDELHGSIDAHERAWQAAFHGRPVVTLCPYMVGALRVATMLGA